MRMYSGTIAECSISLRRRQVRSCYCHSAWSIQLHRRTKHEAPTGRTLVEGEEAQDKGGILHVHCPSPALQELFGTPGDGLRAVDRGDEKEVVQFLLLHAQRQVQIQHRQLQRGQGSDSARAARGKGFHTKWRYGDMVGD